MRFWLILFGVGFFFDLIVGHTTDGTKQNEALVASSSSSSSSSVSSSSSSSTKSASINSKNQWNVKPPKSELSFVPNYVQRNRVQDLNKSPESKPAVGSTLDVTTSSPNESQIESPLASFNQTINPSSNSTAGSKETGFEVKSLDEILDLAGLSRLDVVPSTDPGTFLVKTRFKSTGSCTKTSTKKSKKKSKKKSSKKSSKKSKKKSKKKKKKKKKKKSCCCCCC
ncbi:uncharacterized protein DDB_G0271670 [Tetranychus urticae]|uniref:Uncharacterized protein n=1 Tax=Tetranychus urticae TaxID=32264 RepID=T1KQV6_TETUR|nr:uncharacterized protein DDB_G0271670 [Tetranychus urticae]